MKTERVKRLAQQIRRDLAVAVVDILDDPKASMISITAVRVTRDLSFAKVYVTHVLDRSLQRRDFMQQLNDNAGRFRHYLAKKLLLRKVPTLTFIYDESVEYGAKMQLLLEDLVRDLPPEENCNDDDNRQR